METNPTSVHEHAGYRCDPWPGSVDWGSGVSLNCGVGCRCGSDPALLWLWPRPTAVALIQHLSWELPYATSSALKKQIKAKKKKKRNFRCYSDSWFFIYPCVLPPPMWNLYHLVFGHFIWWNFMMIYAFCWGYPSSVVLGFHQSGNSSSWLVETFLELFYLWLPFLHFLYFWMLIAQILDLLQ